MRTEGKMNWTLRGARKSRKGEEKGQNPEGPGTFQEHSFLFLIGITR